METEIRVRFLNPCSQWAEAYWQAELFEGGEQVWPDVVARSSKSADDARDKLIETLTQQ